MYDLLDCYAEEERQQVVFIIIHQMRVVYRAENVNNVQMHICNNYYGWKAEVTLCPLAIVSTLLRTDLLVSFYEDDVYISS